VSSDQRRDRLNRIKKRALPIVREAYESGQITARRADILLYLPADQQAEELRSRLSEDHEHEARKSFGR
jgi:hypothetical protein